jgi:hypothetical protein
MLAWIERCGGRRKKGWRWAKLRDGRTTIVDSGVRNERKAYNVEQEEERKAGLMATKSWRLFKKIWMLTLRMTTAIWNVTRGREYRRTSAQRLECDLRAWTRPRPMSDSMRRRLPNVMGEI